ncbi:branched-chain amino acid ABC transporter permease [Paraburkholderia elongata]|uniref:Branched-chain amino acid ABC transporter permease n=1 Tax=Paraburkholderia elongata TaxID=2675747 RepID=A0A972NYW0_9BURK|nr:branched-chain amino acid ABC transporter permease [Paraburkholderia elongata]NPT54920.1 branched-chain amino acid ABC transporter permease [Paraburkholderia elongata]NPT60949.1 branched-chain amino acid ABC transporter permease [Paraburkholderia elongata]
MTRPDIAGYFRSRSRVSRWELVFWAAWLGLFFIPGCNLVLLSQILAWGLFALSLDLLLGYRGIPSLGHAAFFGIGAYTAGLLGQHGWTEPISGLLIAGLTAGLTGLVTGRIVRKLHGVGLLMVTLGLNMILFDFVDRSTGLTGGDDGLQGIEIAPVLGLFRFDMIGRTAYLYIFFVVLLCFLGVRALVKSSFGLSLLGARENPRRMIMLGTPIEHDVTVVFGLSAMLAGIAGALLTQAGQFVSPEALAFTRSADVLVMLVIGGTGILYGGFIGATVFILLRDLLSAFNPIYWYFWIGLLLVLIVATFRKGVLPTLVGRVEQLRGRRA